jgi:hypothetical protein
MKKTNRREFLRVFGVGAAVLSATGCNYDRMSMRLGGDDDIGPMPCYDVLRPNSGGYSVKTFKAPPKAVKHDSGHKPWRVKHPRKWRYIVVHHSATPRGSAAVFHKNHVKNRGWRSLGYHFVIPNGNGAPDGAIEIGPRWRRQEAGAHTGKTPGNEYNEYGIGICLVGDCERTRPTALQLKALGRLVKDLAGTHKIPARNIIGHKDAPCTKTNCPGRYLHPYVHGQLRRGL